MPEPDDALLEDQIRYQLEQLGFATCPNPVTCARTVMDAIRFQGWKPKQQSGDVVERVEVAIKKVAYDLGDALSPSNDYHAFAKAAIFAMQLTESPDASRPWNDLRSALEMAEGFIDELAKARVCRGDVILEIIREALTTTEIRVNDCGALPVAEPFRKGDEFESRPQSPVMGEVEADSGNSATHSSATGPTGDNLASPTPQDINGDALTPEKANSTSNSMSSTLPPDEPTPEEIDIMMVMLQAYKQATGHISQHGSMKAVFDAIRPYLRQPEREALAIRESLPQQQIDK